MTATWLRPVAVALGLLAIGALDPGSGVLTWLRLQRDLDAAAQRIEDLEERNAELAEEIGALDDDPFALERAIREELELVRPGEGIVRFGALEAIGPGE